MSACKGHAFSYRTIILGSVYISGGTDFKYFISEFIRHSHPSFLKMAVNINVPMSYEICYLLK